MMHFAFLSQRQGFFVRYLLEINPLYNRLFCIPYNSRVYSEMCGYYSRASIIQEQVLTETLLRISIDIGKKPPFLDAFILFQLIGF